MTLETIIRPFVSYQVTPPTLVRGAPIPVFVPNVVLTIGDITKVPKSFSASASGSMSFYMDSKLAEKAHSPSRTTHKKKIYQNNDPSTGNFVEFEYIDTIWLKGPNGQYYQWKFLDPDKPNP